MLPYRLKEARLKAGLSQQQLGVLAGIDEATASARMNQYERGVHTPDFELVCRLAAVLNIPASYFYTVEDDLAEIILTYARQKKTDAF
ncbi:helix-turn-helix transcriptional regulator [Affinibrenneria salicis]|uniref:Helix-turn-helix transcriptional regulator n=2 Tax=Pectobacteriaceae TaxID=1903410 RepID=A0A5J5FV51_9GAMM|nr:MULTISPECIES: helix-turn-helix transcriptional regulator [Pectobacteriaceae]KAA8997323.1 helix-turn-helix transcriptional regulator [Affinibrenneria salicis]PWC19678.1 transcriptional regulator [Brenneria sp. CFCC 11842]